MKPSVYDIIDMDVLRSFTCFDQPDKEGLKKVLKTTAYDIQDGSYYCQGMNYIAGYFLILMNQNQEQAFYIFRRFINQYMIEIYDDSFRRLQGYFYVLDSVIKNYLPNISKNFKVTLTSNSKSSPCSSRRAGSSPSFRTVSSTPSTLRCSARSSTCSWTAASEASSKRSSSFSSFTRRDSKPAHSRT